jgi:hypothetical protein
MIDFYFYSAKAFILLPFNPLAEASGNLSEQFSKQK